MLQLQFMAENPLRSPTWRWLRAANILDDGGQPTTARRDTPEGYRWIKKAHDFQQAYRRAQTDQQICALAQEMPAIFWAHHIWEQNEQPTKWSIEAHILARETDREIAMRVGCSPEIVAVYESLFFHVREKINYREYVLNTVLADAVHRGLSERNYDLLWKLFGYTGGPHVLDAMVGRLPGCSWAANPDSVPGFFQEAALNLMKKKAAVASLTVPINTSTHLHLIEAFVKYVEIERSTESAGKAQDQILANIEAMLISLPFGVGSHLESAQQKLLPYDEGAFDLTNEDLLAAAAGLPVRDEAALSQLTFPEVGYADPQP